MQKYLNTPPLLNREEAAKMLGVEVSTLASWVTNKRYPLPIVKIGKMVRYRLEDIQKFIEEHQVGVEEVSNDNF